MSNKQKSYLLTMLIIVAVIMLVSRTIKIVTSLEEAGHISIPKIYSVAEAPTPVQAPEEIKHSSSEVESSLIQDLTTQKEILEIASLELEKKDIQLQLVAIELENKLNVIREAESNLLALVKKHDEQKQEDISHLVRLYTNMNSKDATRIIESLDINVAVLLLKVMDTDAASAILAQMSAEKAKEVTNKLIEASIQRK